MHKKVVLQLAVYNDCQKQECHTITWDSDTQQISMDQVLYPADLADFSSFITYLKGQHKACTEACNESSK